MNKWMLRISFMVLMVIGFVAFFMVPAGSSWLAANAAKVTVTVWWKAMGAVLFLGLVVLSLLSFYDFQIERKPAPASRAAARSELPTVMMRRAIK